MASIRSLDPRYIPIARRFLHALAQRGISGRVTSTRRDPDQQAQLYACFKRVGCSDCSKRPGQPGCYPAAAPGASTHAIGWAFDLHLANAAAYRAAGELWESMGYTWGGRFSDPIHFDVRPRA